MLCKVCAETIPLEFTVVHGRHTRLFAQFAVVDTLLAVLKDRRYRKMITAAGTHNMETIKQIHP
jgi:hypothetical protein